MTDPARSTLQYINNCIEQEKYEQMFLQSSIRTLPILRKRSLLSFGETFAFIAGKQSTFLNIENHEILWRTLQGKKAKDAGEWIWKATLSCNVCGPLLLIQNSESTLENIERVAGRKNMNSHMFTLRSLTSPPSRSIYVRTDPTLQPRLQYVGIINQLMFYRKYLEPEENFLRILELVLSYDKCLHALGFVFAMERIYAVPKCFQRKPIPFTSNNRVAPHLRTGNPPSYSVESHRPLTIVQRMM
ncbi:hypothetical protein CC78DRAFT_574132 [Lojkania enalia]|uniref:Uncharacterized protein n=1 Tax=Lojkania enalia TaxID=147567 RepID=A0A9P4NBE7_9PLEO|nr:hypothetical protein CC78DRAFT_574132 [Didymosphaeria enalia]